MIGNKSLAQENLQYAGTAGVSKNNRSRGFVPAFLDADSGQVYRSRFPDGRPAPVHMLSGLPDKLFNSQGASSEQALQRRKHRPSAGKLWVDTRLLSVPCGLRCANH